MSIHGILRSVSGTISGLFFPPHCAACGGDLQERWLCDACRRDLRKIHPPCCDICSEPFHGAINETFTCPNCAGRRYHLTHAVAAYLIHGPVRKLVHSLKYHRRLYVRHPLGELLMDAMNDPRIQAQPVDALVPVPLHPLRRREREFNQAELLAKTLSERTGIPVLHALRRIRNTSSQTQHDRDERMENLRDAFRIRQNVPVQNQRLLLVDDVLTTGSTLNECARVLMNAKAASVRAVTVARG